MRRFPVEHFDIWFRHYLRQERLTYAQYAERVGTTEESIRYMAEGRTTPTSKVLQEMNAKIYEVRKDYVDWKR